MTRFALRHTDLNGRWVIVKRSPPDRSHFTGEVQMGHRVADFDIRDPVGSVGGSARALRAVVLLTAPTGLELESACCADTCVTHTCEHTIQP